jgi:2-keto-4-pentenoate hydratase/2-oxohepta-3-ene-1,7-dioic acid hydratase in catechol pathway
VGSYLCWAELSIRAAGCCSGRPILFLKATSSIVGPDDDILLPRGSQKTDWEVELGVVAIRK